MHVDSDCEVYRKELESVCETYAKEHYTEGVAKVFTKGQTHLNVPEPPAEAKASEEEAVVEKAPETSDEADAVVPAASPVMEMEAAAVEPAAEPSAEDASGDSQMTSEETPVEKEIIGAAVEGESAKAVTTETAVPETPVDAKEPTPEPTPEPLPKKFSVYFVGNRYNPSNYWYGANHLWHLFWLMLIF